MRTNASGWQRCVYIATSMATRESLNKLKINVLKQLATENNINTEKKKKREIVSELLNYQVPSSSLTPVVSQDSETEGLQPKSNENLPPFNKVPYSTSDINIPAISFSNIYDFMILRSTLSGKAVKNFRGLDRAVKHYDAGDIQNIAFAQVDNQTVYVKASCNASMKKIIYEVYVCVSIKPGNKQTVDYAYCQCPIGLAQSCSHIGGLLFALSNLKSWQQPDVSCTSKLCQWKIPRQNLKPQPASSLILAKSTSTSDTTTSIDFDPRHSDDRFFDMDWSLNELTDLKTIFPKTGMSHLWNIPDLAPAAIQEEEMETSLHPLEEKMFQMIFQKSNFPPVSIENELVTYIENPTKGQRLCEMWRTLHRGRITSSLFGDVLAAGSSPTSLIKKIIEGSNVERYNRLPEAMQWGVDHEDTAKKEYIKMKKILNDDFKTDNTGLTLCGSYSFLGASSDGRVTEGSDVGILEIKCPFSVNGTRVTHMQISDIIGLNKKKLLPRIFRWRTKIEKITQILCTGARGNGNDGVAMV